MNIALITGITGQDGSYLTELLLSKEYIVYGILRRSSSINTNRIDHLFHHEKLILRYGDLTDSSGLLGLLHEIKSKNPEMERLEIYNLGAMSHVKVSFDVPEYTADADALGTLRLLNAIRSCGLQDITRFYQASTSEMFGKVKTTPQDESTQLHPRSPYGVAKCFAHWITQNYRESYGMFCVSGILFNHESIFRPERYVTQKIIKSAKMISEGKKNKLELGRLDISRDWGWASEYVEAMWLMLQQEEPEDYVISTGKTFTLQEFVSESFAAFDLDWKEFTTESEKFIRPSDIVISSSNPLKAKTKLNWHAKYSMKEVVANMVNGIIE